MIRMPWYGAFERALDGWPDSAITLGLIVIALLCLWFATTRGPTAKLGFFIYLISP
jgi:hypothetical protein